MTSQLRTPPTEFDEILAVENKLIFPSFTSETAWELGSLIRKRLHEWKPDAPASVVHICLANSGNLLFHAVTKSALRGVIPDNDSWVARKKALVFRWGSSTYAMHYKFKGDQQAFADKYGLTGGKDAEYAIWGGGVPVRVENVEGIVGAVIVSGLKHHEDHQVVIQCMEEYLQGQKA